MNDLQNDQVFIIVPGHLYFSLNTPDFFTKQYLHLFNNKDIIVCSNDHHMIFISHYRGGKIYAIQHLSRAK